MTIGRGMGALAAAIAMFVVLLLGYEIIIQALFGADLLEDRLMLNAGRFGAAAIGALGGAAAVLVPGRRKK